LTTGSNDSYNPGSDGAGRVLQQSGPVAPVTLVLSREVRAGDEGAFEDVLHRLAGEVGRQPGHLDVTVLRPPPGGRRIYAIVSHFASGAAADAWLAGEARAQLVAEADLHAAEELHTGICPAWRAGWPRPAPRCWSRPRGGRPRWSPRPGSCHCWKRSATRSPLGSPRQEARRRTITE